MALAGIIEVGLDTWWIPLGQDGDHALENLQQWSTTNPARQKSKSHWACERKHGRGRCNQSLIQGSCNPDIVKHLLNISRIKKSFWVTYRVKIIANNAIARPLFANAKPDHDEKPPFIAGPSPDRNPGRLLYWNFKLDCTNNFSKFKLDNFILAVAVGMVFREDVECRFFASFADEPAGTFW